MTRQPTPPPSRRERRELDRRDRPLRDRARTPARRRTARPAWQSPFVLVSAAALVIGIVIVVLNQKPSSSASTSDLITPPLTYAADIVDGQTLGRASAPVLLEVWADFQCPVCGRFDREELGTIKTQLVDTRLLRIQAHDLAFLGQGDRDESLELAAGARCASDQGRYWPFHDLVY